MPRSRAGHQGAGGRTALPFRELRVLIASTGHAGVLGRALEASRCLAERGAEVCVVQAPSMQHRSTAVVRVVDRFPFAKLIDGESIGRTVDPETSSVHQGRNPRTFTVCASPHACLDAKSVDGLMRAMAHSRRSAAVAPVLVGPDRAELPRLSALAIPLVWMARSTSLDESACGGPTDDGPMSGGTAPAILRVERLRSATVLVPRPGDVPDARAGAEECQPLAT